MKQQYDSKQFIVINDKVEMDARVFISNRRCGEEQDSGETERERVLETECCWKRRIALAIK